MDVVAAAAVEVDELFALDPDVVVDDVAVDRVEVVDNTAVVVSEAAVVVDPPGATMVVMEGAAVSAAGPTVQARTTTATINAVERDLNVWNRSRKESRSRPRRINLSVDIEWLVHSRSTSDPTLPKSLICSAIGANQLPDAPLDLQCHLLIHVSVVDEDLATHDRKRRNGERRRSGARRGRLRRPSMDSRVSGREDEHCIGNRHVLVDPNEVTTAGDGCQTAARGWGERSGRTRSVLHKDDRRRQCGSTTNSGLATASQNALTSFNILPYLVHGANTIVIRGQNGLGTFAECTGCSYSQHTAGVVFGGSITFETDDDCQQNSHNDDGHSTNELGTPRLKPKTRALPLVFIKLSI